MKTSFRGISILTTLKVNFYKLPNNVLKKYIFQIDSKDNNNVEQEILFSLISDNLITIGCLSVSNICTEDQMNDPLKNIEVIIDDRTAYIQLKKCLEEFVEISNVDEFELVNSTNWVEVYKENVAPVIINNSFVIAPDWIDVPENTQALSIIRINPGLAFGTGSHPTTQMCLRTISSLQLSNKSVIDLGCGSGILGIACIKMGAQNITFVDNDFVALGVTRENLIKNCCKNTDYKLVSSLTKASKKGDFIIANILLNPLKKMAKAIKSRLKKNGQILLSGILIDQVDELLLAFEEQSDRNLVKLEEMHQMQWACVRISYR